MKKTFTLLYFIICISAHAQHEADNWFFGGNLGLNFSASPPTIVTGGQVNTQEGCSSISDATGNLLFYSDGVSVWDRNHSQMPNGSGLLGNASSTQSCLIVAKPGSSTLFYIFTVPVTSSANPFAYSIVDMTLNNGFGDITLKNVNLWPSSTEKLTAVLHQNQTDIWIIGHESNNFNFLSFLLTNTGVSTVPVISNAHLSNLINVSDDMGQMKASPCGNHLGVVYHYSKYAELYDFDNSSGVVSNAVFLGDYTSLSTLPAGIEFSPDNSKLYVCGFNNNFLIQYDVNAGSPIAIAASADTITISSGTNFMFLQTAPDGKIYLANYGTNHLDCITNPNASGTACNFVSTYVTFPTSGVHVGLPGFPPYYFCGIESGINYTANELITSIFPNPATNNLNIQLNGKGNDHVIIEIINQLGEKILAMVKPGNTGDKITIPLNNFSKGIYLLRLQAGHTTIVKKFLVE